MTNQIKKAGRHVSQNETAIFEQSAPGKRGFELPPLDVPEVDARAALGSDYVRDSHDGLPEVSEIEVIRHFTRLSTWNYAIDLGMYPLGSCTMKYNPRVNEFVARLDGLATEHPYQPQELSQGCLKIVKLLLESLVEITGMDMGTLEPAAGAQGELTGLLLIRAYLEDTQGRPRKRVLIPDSAHGTNPATAVIAGYEVQNVASDVRGQIDVARLKEIVNDDVAAMMVTNPSTLGVFEQRIADAAEILHERGALLYMDGANMNALAGVARPGDFGVDVMHLNLHKTFSTPHGGGGPGAGPVMVKKILEPYLPIPVLMEKRGRLSLESQRPKSIGRMRAFGGNFGVLVRALAYTMAYGPGIRQATEDAVLNANYIRKKLEAVFDLPFDSPSMHEVVFSDARQKKKWREHDGHRQAPDRLWLPSLHNCVSADRAWSHDDRTHGIRVEAGMRPVRGRDASHRRGSRHQPRNRQDRAALDARRPSGRSHRRTQARTALEAKSPLLARVSPTDPSPAESHRIDHRLKCRVVGVKIILRRDADKKEQSLRPLDGHQPVAFVPADGRTVCEIGR